MLLSRALPPSNLSTRLLTAKAALGQLSYEAANVLVSRENAAPLLSPGALHEWYAADSLLPPVGLAACLAHQSVACRPQGRAVFVGPDVFPYVLAFSRCRSLAEIMSRAIFVDAPRAHRAFVLEVVLRCAATTFMIADGRGMDMALSRRLQLSANSGGTLAIALRPASELGELSAAATRWLVRPCLSDDDQPRWSIELLRCKGMQPTTDARRWTVRICHETGDVRLAPHAADRFDTTSGRSPP